MVPAAGRLLEVPGDGSAGAGRARNHVHRRHEGHGQEPLPVGHTATPAKVVQSDNPVHQRVEMVGHSKSLILSLFVP